MFNSLLIKVCTFFMFLFVRDRKVIINWTFRFLNRKISDFVLETDNKIDDKALEIFQEKYAENILNTLTRLKIPNWIIVDKIKSIEVQNDLKIDLTYDMSLQTFGLKLGALESKYDTRDGSFISSFKIGG